MINKKVEALYVHIPFCDHICTYCDFYKMVSKKETHERYIDYIIKELHYRKSYLDDIKTIYIGGGSPSCLSLELLEKLFHAFSTIIDMKKVVEYTIEMNPKDIINSNFNQEVINSQKTDYSTKSIIKLLQKYGLNRISLGIQSFNDEKLVFLGRNHTGDEAKKAIEIIKNANSFSLNCDLIYGINDDEEDLILKDLQILTFLGVESISTYALSIEDKTILNRLYKNKDFVPVSDDKDRYLYDSICNFLANHHYNHYEISNFAKAHHESKHNLTYWNNELYLGLGANASYYLGNKRYTNINNLSAYFEGIDNKQLAYKEEIELTIKDIMDEEIFLGLRKIQGINKQLFLIKFSQEIADVYVAIKDLLSKNILIEDDLYIAVHPGYIYVLNKIILEIIGD